MAGAMGDYGVGVFSKTTLIPVARELAPARLLSSRKPGYSGASIETRLNGFGAAAQPSGSKLPRHNSPFTTQTA
ncbi:hypothetical protein EMIT0P100_20381 [Pseudomonas sp. IT-P100]